MKVRLAKFAFVGAIGTLLQLGLLKLLIAHTPPSAVLANAIALELTLLHNFLWHERFTWRSRHGRIARAQRLWRFHLGAGIVSLGGNTCLTGVFIDLLRWPPIPSALFAIALCSLANFWLVGRWVYPLPPRRATAHHQKT